MSEKPTKYRRSGRAKSIAEHLKPVTRRSFGKRGFADGDMIAAWPAVIGPELSKVSIPERVVYPTGKRAGGTLHLRIASGSFAVELQHMLPLLIERINGYFGYRAVDRVHLIQAPIPTPKKTVSPVEELGEKARTELARMLADVDDPEIRASLEKLGSSMLSRAPRNT